MEESTLTALSQRPEAFWLGLALLLGGSLAAEVTAQHDQLLSAVVALGGLVLTVRIAVAVYRILRTTVAAGWNGYRAAGADAESETDA